MTILLAVLIGLTATGESAVVNGGFEQVNPRTGMPSDWSFTCLLGKQDLVTYSTKSYGTPDQGDRALSISVAPGHPEERVAYNAHQDLKQLTAGKTYRVSTKVRSEGLTTLPIIVVQCLDETGTKYLAFARSVERKLSEDLIEWERVHTEITVPAGTDSVRVRIGIPAEGNAGGTAVIDDVVVIETK